MPIIRILVSFLVLAFGLLVAAVLLVLGLLSFFLQRLFGRPAAMPQFRASARRATPPPSVRPRDDVIDVEVTPVKE